LPAAPPLGREIAIIGVAAALISAGFASLPIVSGLAAVRAFFPLDHAIKLTIFVVTLEALSRLLWGLERIARFDTTPIIDRAYLATTPGEFWRRWNTRVGTWLDRNVFRRSGGRRAPIRGIVLAFSVSALLHEVAFAIATSRFTGCQFAFFMLQAPVVALSHRIAPFVNRGGPAIKTVARVLTVLWFYVTSVLFFEGVNRVFPFLYASQPWLPWGT
jgi:D-alanyl-lipoteichoic acid acyltransferase DltB (MBOAT superfamily)